MNLLAVMAMCHGRHLISQLEPSDIAPVWGVIGPYDEIFPARLQEAFDLFYRELLTAQNGSAALEAMNARHAAGTWDLVLDTAEVMFARIFLEYVKVKCSQEELGARENALVAQIARQFNYDIGRAMHSRAVAREWLADHRTQFEKYRRSFLMLDLFPENEARFPISYADLQALTALNLSSLN
jgi:hypothetical protein